MSLYNLFNQEIKDCKCCLSEINSNNYVLYKDNIESEYKSSFFCSDCVSILVETGWNTYISNVNNADCAAALKRLIEKGPPINLRDDYGVPCDNENNEVVIFYFGDGIKSAKLNGSLVGDERLIWWGEMALLQKTLADLNSI